MKLSARNVTLWSMMTLSAFVVAINVFGGLYGGWSPNVAYCNRLSKSGSVVNYYDSVGQYLNYDNGYESNSENSLKGCFEKKIVNNQDGSSTVKYFPVEVPANLNYTDIPGFWKAIIITALVTIPLTLFLFAVAAPMF